MKFKVLDTVKITEGFFKDQKGVIVDYDLFNATYLISFNFNATLLSTIGTKSFRESILELIND